MSHRRIESTLFQCFQPLHSCILVLQHLYLQLGCLCCSATFRKCLQAIESDVHIQNIICCIYDGVVRATRPYCEVGGWVVSELNSASSQIR